MLNELYSLSATLENKGITVEEWHDDYQEIPNVSDKSPCIRLWIADDGTLCDIETLTAELAGKIRKYGGKQGTFPVFNVFPLYRLINDEQIKNLEAVIIVTQHQ